MDLLTQPLFTITNLHYRPHRAKPWLFNDFSLEAQPQEIIALTGPNGAGKSTLLKIIAGVLIPPKANIYSGIPQNKVAYLPDTLPLYSYLTVKEQLYWNARFRGLPEKAIPIAVSNIIQQLKLDTLSNLRIHSLSAGQKRLVGLAGALIHQPLFILLDEPMNDLDNAIQTQVIRYLQSCTAISHSSIIFSTHHQKDIENFATRVINLPS